MVPDDVFDATVFVSGILGATARIQSMDIRSIASWTNEMFHQVTEAVLRFDGVPVKFMGDGFLCFFAGQDHQSRGVRAAIGARESVTDPLVIGLSSGETHLATIGHPSYARPDILGPTVNRAVRVLGWVQSNAKSRIGASVETLVNLNGSYDLGGKIEVQLKGFAEPVTIQEILGLGFVQKVDGTRDLPS